MNLLLIILFLLVAGIFGWISTSGMKSQLVRLFDILVFGPILIYIATLQDKLIYSLFLYFFGMTTITYNLKNYLHQLD